MKDTVALIPQVFYDLIGRLIPGSAIIMMGFVISTDIICAKAMIIFWGSQPATISVSMVFIFILIAYLLGLLLGVIGFIVSGDGVKRHKFEEIKNGFPIDPICETDMPFIYDYISIHDVNAGARLAKLRAESHMCSVLIVGGIILLITHIVKNWSELGNCTTILMALILISMVILSYFFYQHLKVRTWRLEVNCWNILREKCKQPSVDENKSKP